MKDSLRTIWTSELVLEATKAEIEARNVPEGCHVIPQGIATLGKIALSFVGFGSITGL